MASPTEFGVRATALAECVDANITVTSKRNGDRLPQERVRL